MKKKSLIESSDGAEHPIESDVSAEKEDDIPHEEHYCVKNGLGAKSGKYIFTVGNVSSGKSTLQTAMISRLARNPYGIRLDLVKRNVDKIYKKEDKKKDKKRGDHRHDRLLNTWIEDFEKGYLPDRTQKGRLQEFAIKITQAGRRPLELNFLEISGEDINSVVGTVDIDTPPKVNNQLNSYLENKNVYKKFIFVSDGTAISNEKRNKKTEFDEDTLFCSLLDYLDEVMVHPRSAKQTSVLIVAAKWDAIKGDGTLDEYLEDKLPRTMNKLRSKKYVAKRIAFSVGTVKQVESTEESRVVDKIEDPEYKYIDYVIQWIYYSYNKQHLKFLQRMQPSFWDNLLRMLSFSIEKK